MPVSVSLIWLIAGAVLLALEAFGIPGIGFLFVGLAALLVGLLVETHLLAAGDMLSQWVVFFLSTSLLAIFLWNRLKAWRMNPSAEQYSNMLGTEAVVTKTLVGDLEGEVRWSGTLMRAKLMPHTGTDIVTGSIVVIRHVEGNVLSVVPKH